MMKIIRRWRADIKRKMTYYLLGIAMGNIIYNKKGEVIDFIYSCEELEKRLKTPYDLIDINTGSEHFIFRFTECHAASAKSIDDVAGEFGIIYKSKGISCEFGCDISIGNVYLFYIELDNAYDILFGKAASAMLENYGSIDRTRLTADFDCRGRCTISGSFKNKESFYRDGISFSLEAAQSDITYILNSMKQFFRTLTEIQGHINFY